MVLKNRRNEICSKSNEICIRRELPVYMMLSAVFWKIVTAQTGKFMIQTWLIDQMYVKLGIVQNAVKCGLVGIFASMGCLMHMVWEISTN